MLIHKLAGELDSVGTVCPQDDTCIVCNLKDWLDILCNLGLDGHRIMAMANQAHEDGHE